MPVIELGHKDVPLNDIQELIKQLAVSAAMKWVDDPEDVEARDDANVLGDLTLSVVEVDGDGDDGMGDLLAQVDLSGNFFGGL